MIEMHLHQQSAARYTSAPPALHLDEDSLAAFAEARLSEREAAPVFAHLVACDSCRRAAAALLRLADELAELDAPLVTTDAAPSRIRQMLADFAARLAPFSDEAAVLAYGECEENQTETEKQKESAESNSQTEESNSQTNDSSDGKNESHEK